MPKKRIELIDSVIFKSGNANSKGKYDEFYVSARGSGNKNSVNYGLKSRKVSSNVAHGLRKRYGTNTKRAGNFGYDANIPSTFF